MTIRTNIENNLIYLQGQRLTVNVFHTHVAMVGSVWKGWTPDVDANGKERILIKSTYQLRYDKYSIAPKRFIEVMTDRVNWCVFEAYQKLLYGNSE